MLRVLFEIAVGLIVGYVGAFLYERIGIWLASKSNKPPHLDVRGYRLHHSLYGLLFIAVGVVAQNVFLIAVGVGTIIQHYFTGDGLVFITKVG